MEVLNRREREIVRLMAAGLMDAEIGEQLTLGINTIKWYARQIYAKLGVRNRREAIVKARELGYLADTPPPIATPATTTPFIALPVPTTSFIGRQTEIGEIQALFRKTRLVTLTGLGGSGKTRLALEVAAAMTPQFDDGAAFISLAALQDPSLLAIHIAQGVGADLSQRDSPLGILQHHLHNQHCLLVLDNFEHLVEAAPLVTDLLSAAPRLYVLATSREVLHLSGEYQYPVRPLPLPDHAADLTILAENEAVQLFCERAQAHLPNFALHETNATDIAGICLQLDGLPLGIELAAARIKRYAPHTLREKLRHRLDVLTSGPRDAPQRQKTLRDTLAWSYDLLTSDEKTLFARMGVFVGGCTIDAALVVAGEGLRNPERTLESLADKNLIGIDLREDEPRCTMLETMREYAWERLMEHDETALFRHRHAQYYVELAEFVELNRVPKFNDFYYFDRVEHDIANIRAVLDRAIETEHPPLIELGLRICGGLNFYWSLYFRADEGRAYMEALLRLATASPLELRAAVLFARAWQSQYPPEATQTRLDLACDALAIYQQVGAERQVAWTQWLIAELFNQLGQHERAMSVLAEAITYFRHVGDSYGLVFTLWRQGKLLVTQGNDVDAARAFAESQTLRTSFGGMIAHTVQPQLDFAFVLLRLGEVERAEALVKQSAANIAFWVVRGIRTYRLPLQAMAMVRLAQGRYETATQLHGAAERLRLGGQLPTNSDRFMLASAPAMATAREQLGDAAFEAAYAAGMAMTEQEALALAGL